jgi:YegS/Rv2252/BmrU family lipid kinase
MSHHHNSHLPLPFQTGSETQLRHVAAAECNTPRKRILIVANPAAGSISRRRLERMVRRLEILGCSVSVHETRHPGEGERFIASADGGSFDAVAAAGGDGTFNELLNGLAENGPPLAVLPFGTANVLAKEIGLGSSVRSVADAVAFGPVRRVAVGEANGRRFSIMASVGFDAQVVDAVDLALKRRIGKAAYLFETIKQMIRTAPTAYRLRIDGRIEEVQGVIVANGRCYAGHYVTSPSASLDKPSFDVCRLTEPGRLKPASYFLSLMLGRFSKRRDIRISEATELDILGPEGAPVQADGDIICRLPAAIRIVPAAVDLIFPAAPSPPRF